MRKLMQLCAWLCAMVFVVGANPAQATGANPVSYVSNTGSDANNCTDPTTQACATFQHALNETGPDGVVDCVNAGSYGGVNIMQSVSIDCASGVSSSVGAIVVSGNGIVVKLSNLSIYNNGFGDVSIQAQNMAALYVENCVIVSFTVGIQFGPSAGPSQLFVSNSIISHNGNSSGVTGGIYIVPGSGVTAEVSINRSEINGNYFGIVGDGRSGGIIKGAIKDSVVSGNTENGITAISSGSSVVLITDQTNVTENGVAGLAASGSGSGILARNTTVFENAIGLDTANGGTLYTYGNNSVNGNTTNGAFTGTVAQQ